MPIYDMKCVGCGHVEKDVVVKPAMAFGVEMEIAVPTRSPEGVVDVPKQCRCGGWKWTRAKAAHACAKTSRLWGIGCHLNKNE